MIPPSIADTDPDTDTVTGTGDIGTCAPDDAQDENGDLGGSVEAEKVTATPDGDKLSEKSEATIAVQKPTAGAAF